MEVVEGERRGDSTGETSAVEGYDVSESVEVIVLLKTGFLAAGWLDVDTEAMTRRKGGDVWWTSEAGEDRKCWVEGNPSAWLVN